VEAARGRAGLTRLGATWRADRRGAAIPRIAAALRGAYDGGHREGGSDRPALRPRHRDVNSTRGDLALHIDVKSTRVEFSSTRAAVGTHSSSPQLTTPQVGSACAADAAPAAARLAGGAPAGDENRALCRS